MSNWQRGGCWASMDSYLSFDIELVILSLRAIVRSPERIPTAPPARRRNCQSCVWLMRAKKEPSEQPKALHQVLIVFDRPGAGRDPGYKPGQRIPRLKFLIHHRHHLTFFGLNMGFLLRRAMDCSLVRTRTKNACTQSPVERVLCFFCRLILDME